MQFLKWFQFLMQRISSLKHDILCFPIMSTLKVTWPEVPSINIKNTEHSAELWITRNIFNRTRRLFTLYLLCKRAIRGCDMAYLKTYSNKYVCETRMPPFPNLSRIGLTFDLDLWPTNLNIDRGHLLIQDYLPTTFEASGAKRSWVISCIRWSRLAWPWPLTCWPEFQ